MVASERGRAATVMAIERVAAMGRDGGVDSVGNRMSSTEAKAQHYG